jgi:hypothetical protein
MVRLLLATLVITFVLIITLDQKEGLTPDNFCHSKLETLPDTIIITNDIRLNYPIISFVKAGVEFKMDIRSIEAEHPTSVAETFQYELDYGYQPVIAIQTVGNRQIVSMVVGLRNKKTEKTFSCSLHPIASVAIGPKPQPTPLPRSTTRA